MTAYSAVTSGQRDSESPIDTVLIGQVIDNPVAITEKSAGAPVLANDYIVLAMMANDSVDQSNIVNNSIGQSELKIASSTISGISSFGSAIILAGGSYGLSLRVYSSGGGNRAALDYSTTSTANQSNATLIIGSGGTAYANQSYVSASPPYDLGDGDIPLFVFAVIDNSTNKVESVYVAPEAPWHYNGKTSIIATRKDRVSGKSYKMEKAIITELRNKKMDVKKAIRTKKYSRSAIADRFINDKAVEIEITQAIKNADMIDIPHPFVENNLTGKTVVMLDPVSTERLLALHEEGENINELLHDGTIVINNSPLIRATPQNVKAYGFKL